MDVGDQKGHVLVGVDRDVMSHLALPLLALRWYFCVVRIVVAPVQGMLGPCYWEEKVTAMFRRGNLVEGPNRLPMVPECTAGIGFTSLQRTWTSRELKSVQRTSEKTARPLALRSHRSHDTLSTL